VDPLSLFLKGLIVDVVIGTLFAVAVVCVTEGYRAGYRTGAPKTTYDPPALCYDGRDINHTSLCRTMHGRRWAA
jgi:hypothetical protein